MKLSDLLDELRTNILNDRSDRTAGSADYLWTDATLVRYINEAQRRFAKRGYVIRDNTTSEVVNVTIVAGQTEYTLHQAILAVVSAKISGSQADLVRIGHSALGSFSNPSTMIYSPSFETLAPGAPLAYTTDETLGEDDEGTITSLTLRVFPTPRTADAGTVIKLRVVRMPLDDLTTNDLGASPEIPADSHLEMLDWAAYLALRIVDDDAGSPKRAAEFAATFESHVQEARKLVLRKLFAPRSWGFGAGGFSWEG